MPDDGCVGPYWDGTKLPKLKLTRRKCSRKGCNNFVREDKRILCEWCYTHLEGDDPHNCHYRSLGE